MKTSIDKKTFQNLPSFEPPSSFFCSRWIFFTSWHQIGALAFPSVAFKALNFIIGNFVAITRVTQQCKEFEFVVKLNLEERSQE